MKWWLNAEREACEPQVLVIAEQTSESTELMLAGLADMVDDWENEETWPEGYDAIARTEDGRAWVYTDKWEAMS